MTRTFIIVLSFFCLSFLPVAAQARSEQIAVVVNDDVISLSDVAERLKLIMISSGLPDSQEIRDKLKPQILDGLIEEQLKMQEAERLEIRVSPEEIAEGFAAIAAQNNMSQEQFQEALGRSGINVRTMERQIRAQMAWSKVIQAQVRPQIVITDTDIDAVLARMQANLGKTEYLTAEIFLPVDDPQREGDIRQLAARLVSEIRAGKAPFFAVARQFSKAAGAAQGGDLGWIQEGQLAEDLNRALVQMDKGGISDPVRSLSGYHILYVRDKRTISEDTMPGRDAVMESLGLDRLDKAQQRYLLDLKAAAFIESRV